MTKRGSNKVTVYTARLGFITNPTDAAEYAHNIGKILEVMWDHIAIPLEKDWQGLPFAQDLYTHFHDALLVLRSSEKELTTLAAIDELLS
jgi:hypothetical protein